MYIRGLYIRGLIPQNFVESAEAFPIEQTTLFYLFDVITTKQNK